MNDSRQKLREAGFLFVASATLLTLVMLYVTREFDDNRLTSWQWCFQEGAAVRVFLATVLGVVVSYLYSYSSLDRRYRPAVLFVLGFAVSSFFRNEPEVIVDASRYFTQAKHLELYGIRYFVGEWGKEIVAWTDMPLVPFLYGIIFRVFGEARMYVQIATGAMFAGSVVLTYFTGKELWDEEVGFYGGLFLLGMPYLLTQTPLMLVDVPSMFFLVLAFFAFLMALRKGGAAVYCAAGAISLAFFAKYSTWLMLSVLAAAAGVYIAKERSGKKMGKPGNALRRTVYTFLAAAVLIGGVCIYKYGVIADQIHLLITYQKPGLRRWSESFVSTFLFQIHPFITVLAAFSLYAAFRKKDVNYIIIIWLAALVVLLQIKRIRYIIMVFPMFSLAASYGLRHVQFPELRRFIAACAITSSLAVSLFAYLPFLESMSAVNLRDAGSFLDSLAEQEVEVFTLMPKEPAVNPAVSVPILDIFTTKHVRYDYHEVLPPKTRKEMERSSLRFTLVYKNPPYYLAAGYPAENTVAAVISEDINDVLPDEIRGRLAGRPLLRSFAAGEGLFRYQTSVRIYGRKTQ